MARRGYVESGWNRSGQDRCIFTVTFNGYAIWVCAIANRCLKALAAMINTEYNGRVSAYQRQGDRPVIGLSDSNESQCWSHVESSKAGVSQ